MSWERSRYIPWSRLDEVSASDGSSFESQKERVFRSLQREASKEKDLLEKSKDRQNIANSIILKDGGTSSSDTFVPPEVLAQQSQKKKGLFHSGVDYSTPDLVRTIAFGGCIGAITGTVFGFMDSMRTAQENTILKNASNMAKSKYLLEGTTRSGLIFGAFFSGFQTVKYAIRVVADPGLVAEAAGATAVSLGALMVKPATRPSIPYAAMLIGMDCFSIYMKQAD